MAETPRVPLRRRLFLLAAAGLVPVIIMSGLLAPLVATAQSEKVWQVGFLTGGARPPDGLPPLALRQALQELGYAEHRNVAYVVRWADARQERLPALAAELVALNVHAIVTVGGPATEAARQATSSIPIVMGLVGDAVALGLINSLARPGGNVTGVTDESVALSAKRLELLKEAVPKAARMAILYNADDRGMTRRYREVERAAQVLHVTVLSLGMREPDDFDAAFQAMVQHRPDALFLVTDALTLLNRRRVIEFAEKHRIPAMFEVDSLVRDGGLMSYGASPDDNFRRAAVYLDRLFKGAAPSTLPVERPSRYYLAVNLKTARGLGLTLPPSLLQRADQVVE